MNCQGKMVQIRLICQGKRNSRAFKILNMFDRDSRPTITESVVKSADSAVESADYWSRPTGNWPSGYGP